MAEAAGHVNEVKKFYTVIHDFEPQGICYRGLKTSVVRITIYVTNRDNEHQYIKHVLSRAVFAD